MKIKCKWDEKKLKAKVKFIDIPEDVDGLDFLAQCSEIITQEFDKLEKFYLENDPDFKKQTPSNEADYGSFL